MSCNIGLDIIAFIGLMLPCREIHPGQNYSHGVCLGMIDSQL